MQKTKQEYELDLTRAEGSGDFKCPKCKVTISPDDQTENVYTIREVKTKRDTLVELLIQCNRCMSLIHLTGFNLANPTCERPRKKKESQRKNAIPLQITC
jgi:phage FluMu protein Com